MGRNDLLTKLLAVVGTVMIWLPILAPVLFAAARGVQSGKFLFDYLMPAELFPIVLIGGGLLLWSAVRARLHRGLIGWSLLAAVVLLFGSQGLAVMTGLASGAIEATGWQWALTLGMIVVYALLVVVMGVGGVLLLRDLFQAPRTAADRI